MRTITIATTVMFLAFFPVAAVAQSMVVVSVAGEGYDGPPEFEISVDGNPLGRAMVAGAIETTTDGRIFSLERPSLMAEQHQFALAGGPFRADSILTISLTNDRFDENGSGLDRNLFIGSVEVAGIRIPAEDIKVSWVDVEIEFPLIDGMRPVYASGQVAIINPPRQGWPTSSSTAAVRLPPLPLPRPAGL